MKELDMPMNPENTKIEDELDQIKSDFKFKEPSKFD